MTDSTALVELEKHLVEATGPDREIDLALSVAINFKDMFSGGNDWRWNAGGDEIVGTFPPSGKKTKPGTGYLDPSQFVPRWTGSIDAALALVSRCLPGAEYDITTLYGVAHVQLPLNGEEWSDGRREDGNVPLAILLALVRALQSQSKREAGDA